MVAWALLWAVSGFSMLALESVWIRLMARQASTTAVAAAAVTAVFFVFAALGNGLGAWLATGSARPLRRYGSFEVLAALTAAGGYWIAPFAGLTTGWFAETLLLAAPASLCSGVGFAFLSEAFVTHTDQRTTRGGFFYGMNLLGAALGVAAGGVWLPWWFGTEGALEAAAAAQLGGGVFAWGLSRPTGPTVTKPHATGPAYSSKTALGWALLIASGFLSLAAQTLLILWARQVMEGSVYAVCGVMIVFIGGLGMGSLAVAALRQRGWPAMPLLTRFASASAAMLFLTPFCGSDLCLRDLALTADSPTGLLFETLWRCLLLLPLTFCLGGVFPLSWERIQPRADSHGRVLGIAVAANKIAAGIGSVVALFVWMPLAGLPLATQVVGWGYAAVAIAALTLRRPLSWRRLAPAALLVVFGVVSMRHTEPALGITPDLRLIAGHTGAYGPVAVVEDRGTKSRQILLNTRQRLSGTQGALSTQRHQSWVPLLLCLSPKRVANIGMAAGISAAAALDWPVGHLDSVELVPEVVDAARLHFAEWNSALFTDPRSKIIVDDGRRVLRQPRNWDAIICDLFFPAEEGSVLLYSKEFFEQARGSSSLFCLWLPCYQHTAESAGMIVRTFTEVFPCAIMVRANLDPLAPVVGLIGSSRPVPLSPEFLSRQLSTPSASAIAAQSPFFRSVRNAQMLLICDLHSAEPSFMIHPMITDDRPLLAWLGPRQPRGKERLIGFPFLEWIGKRALGGRFPSVELGGTTPDQLLNTIRAGNYFFAASAALPSLPGDPRPPAVREQQVRSYLHKARELCPDAALTEEDLGR